MLSASKGQKEVGCIPDLLALKGRPKHATLFFLHSSLTSADGASFWCIMHLRAGLRWHLPWRVRVVALLRSLGEVGATHWAPSWDTHYDKRVMLGPPVDYSADIMVTHISHMFPCVGACIVDGSALESGKRDEKLNGLLHCDWRYSAIASRGQIELRYPLWVSLFSDFSWFCPGLGGYSAMPCDTWKTKGD